MIGPIDKVTGETIYQSCQRRDAGLQTVRSAFIPHYQTLSRFIVPRSTRFSVSDKNQTGTKRNTNIINNTATLALRTAKAGFMSGVTSPSRPWFNLKTANTDLNKVQNVKVWLDHVKQLMVEVFLKSNLYTTLPLVYSDLLIYGTSCFALMEDDDDGIRCYHYPIGSYSIATSHRGNVNAVYREFKQSVGQLVAHFGFDNCSRAVKEAYNTKSFDMEFTIKHVMEENPDHDPNKMESMYLPFRSIYYEVGGNFDHLLSLKGTHEFAAMAPRWEVTGEDSYGISPGMDVLGDVMQLQTQEKRGLQLLDMLVQPPRNVPASLRNEYVGTLAGENTFVPDNQLVGKVEPNYVPNPNIQHLGMSIQMVEQRIKKGLFEDLFLMIDGIDRGSVTATEIQARQQEKMMAMGPVLERLNDEMLDPLIKRTFGILLRAGAIPEPPPELQGQDIAVEYVSIMAQAMKLQGVVAVERLVGFIGSVGTTRQDALDKLNTDETIDSYADMIGTPPQLVNDAKTVAEIRQQRAQMEQMQQQMAMAQQAAATAKTMADTDVSTPSMLQSMAGVLNQAGPMAGA
jgi:hypothetical protein